MPDLPAETSASAEITSDTAELSYLKDLRGHLRTKVTKKCKALSQSLHTLSTQEAVDNITVLDGLQDKLFKLDEKVTRALWASETDKAVRKEELTTCDKYEDELDRVRKLLKSRIAAVSTPEQPSSGRSKDFARISNQLKLPKLPLPRYNHEKGESLERFFENFEAIVNKYEITGHEKFIFLEERLSGAPRTLIQSLQGTQQSYAEAKALLTKAFANELVQKYDIIKRLSSLKLSNDGDPYEFISNMRIIIQTFDTLKIDVKTVLQYFFWSALNDNFQRQLIAITNCNKPSLDQIQNMIFEATERYLSVHNSDDRKATSKQNSTADCKAAAISYNQPTKQGESPNRFKSCCLCSTGGTVANHTLSKCTVYDTPVKKSEKLKAMKRCLKCANSHPTSECRFKFFKQCFNCKRGHFTFLCLSHNSGVSNKNKDVSKSNVKTAKSGSSNAESENTNGNLNCGSATVNFNMLQSSSNNRTILPTFTCSLQNGRSLRALKDSGCECNFILEDIANLDKFKIVKPVNITVNGFNSVKNYDTVEVEFVINLNDNSHTITAICVPKISVNLDVPEVCSIARSFANKGHVMADKSLLSDVQPGIDLILGSVSAFCLPEKTVVFGREKISSFSETPIGTMLMGSVVDFQSNLSFVPSSPGIYYHVHSNTVQVEPSAESADSINCVSDVNVNLSTVDSENVFGTDNLNEFVGRSFSVLNAEGDIVESELEKATINALANSDNLSRACSTVLNYDNSSAVYYSD